MRRYLDGAVTVATLGGDAAEGLFRGGDGRGRVAWLARGTPCEYLHVVELGGPGVRRGFHRHRAHTEQVYVFSGAVTLVVADDDARAEVPLAEGELATIAPGVAHGLVADAASVALVLGTGSDPLADTEATPDL